jgi:hypothetical protein
MRTLTVLCLALVAGGCGDDASTSMTAADMAVEIDDLTPPGDMVVLKAECDVFANSGCPSGQKCTVGTQNGTPRDLCAPVSATTVGTGASCMSVDIGNGRTGDNCAPGLICLDFPGDGPHCRKPCYARGDCPGQACVFTTPTSTQRMSEAGVQTLHACANDDGCDPVAQNVCSGGRKCWLSPPDNIGRVGVCLMPLSPGGMAGDACVGAMQAGCAPGFRCDNFDFCRRYCYYTAPDGGTTSGTGSCGATEGTCNRFEFSGPLYGICGNQ